MTIWLQVQCEELSLTILLSEIPGIYLVAREVLIFE